MQSITISEVAENLKNKSGLLDCISYDDELCFPVVFEGVRAEGNNLVLLNTHEIFGEDNVVNFDTEGNPFLYDGNENYYITVGIHEFKIEIEENEENENE